MFSASEDIKDSPGGSSTGKPGVVSVEGPGGPTSPPPGGETGPPASADERREVELTNLVNGSRMSPSQASLRSSSSSVGSVRGDEGGLYTDFYGDYCPLFEEPREGESAGPRGEVVGGPGETRVKDVREGGKGDAFNRVIGRYEPFFENRPLLTSHVGVST